jgi:hypothetical protein
MGKNNGEEDKTQSSLKHQLLTAKSETSTQ